LKIEPDKGKPYILLQFEAKRRGTTFKAVRALFIEWPASSKAGFTFWE
jgi:hypothetical protein